MYVAGAQTLRSKIVTALELDVVCLCETFLLDQQQINMHGYTWFGNNRRNLSKRTSRGSGGVGMLIKIRF